MQASHYISSGSTTSPKHFQANFFEKSNGEGGIKDYLTWVRDHLGTPFSVSKSYKVGAAPFKASIKIITVSSNLTLAKVTSTEHILVGDSRRKVSPMQFYEFHLGKVDCANAGATTVPEGLVLIDPDRKFEWHTNNNFTLFIIRISKSALLPLLGGRIEDYLGKPVTLDTPFCKTLSLYVKNAFPLIYKTENTMELSALSAALLDLIVGAFSHVPTNMTHSDAGRAALFSQALDYIDSHCLTHDLRPQDIATHLNISLSYLYSLFRQRGQSVSSEIWNRRLLCAHSMLHDGRHSNKSITEIGFLCRFTSLAHFSRMYKKHFARSPSEQRKNDNKGSCY